MVEEYFSSADVSDTARSLDDMQQPLYQHYFVKRLVGCCNLKPVLKTPDFGA
jgi:hypothetical protein